MCTCVCVHCGIRMCSQSKLFVRGGEGEVWGAGDCDPSAPLHTTVLSCILLFSLAYHCALLHTTVLSCIPLCSLAYYCTVQYVSN